MKILYHHRTQGTGAEGVHIGHVVKSLREIGHQVDVVSPNDGDPTQTAGNNPYANKTGFKARFLDWLSRILPQVMFELLELAYNASAAKKINAQLQKGKIDLLYERNAFFLFAGARIAKRHRIPYIVEVNEVAGEDRVRKQFFIGTARRIEKEVFDAADAIIVVSTFLKKKIESMGVQGSKIHVIPNAADASIFDPEKCREPVREQLGIPADAVVMGFIGWFVAWHNFGLLIEALGKLKDQNVYLMLVGDGVLKDEIVESARKHGCADRVIFPGAVKHNRIPEYINAMDICIIPGSNEYRSPIKLFEYMLMGKPVVAPRLEPIEYIVKDGVEAVLFTQGQITSFVDATADLVSSEEKRRTIGENARALILSKHLWRHNAQRVIDIWDALPKQ